MTNSSSETPSYKELFLISMTALFVELLVIRWMSSDVRAFIIFRTFPLVSCFVGFGAGFASKSDRLFKYSPIFLLIFVVLMKASEAFGFDFWQFPSMSNFQWQNLAVGETSVLYLLKFVLILTVMLSAAFLLCMSIATRLGTAFSKLTPLKAYAFDLLGSLIGSLIFSGLSYLEIEPWKLASLASLPLFIYAYRRRSTLASVIPALLSIALIPLVGIYTPDQTAIPLSSKLLGYQSEATQTYWSPYQRIDVNVYGDNKTENNQFYGLELCVNRAFYQYYLNDEISLDKLPADLRQTFDDRRKFYEVPFSLGPAKEVLVVGAGTGQNVAAALSHGAESVDAVDIDPVILRLGARYNPSYKDPRVHLICDDARHYFRQTKKKYDLIIFTMLDSQAVVGSGSSVRLDAYVYTQESIKQALSLLKPNGNVAIAFAVFKPWIAERLVRILTDASGYKPSIFANTDQESWRAATYFVLGDQVKSGTAAPVPAGWTKRIIDPPPQTKSLTDDWPYLYVRPEIIDYPYLFMVAEILLLSVFVGRKMLFGKNSLRDWQMSFLGAGFLLLELHAISFLSLLYGSTWITSAVVINSILLMIMLANLLVIRLKPKLVSSEKLLYILIFIAILLSYFMPVQSILASMEGLPGTITVTVITLLPIFIAGLIFPTAFSLQKDAPRALGFNLFGCLLGGLLEYLSTYTGIRSLELVAAGLYGLAFIATFDEESNSSSPESPPAISSIE